MPLLFLCGLSSLNKLKWINDYYPFGMGMVGRKYSALSSYRYGFNGKENDNEVKGNGDQQDYGMRIYDSRLGRFLSVDPLTKSFPMLTPYQFSSNSPVQNIDLDGAEGTRYKIQVNGKPIVEVVSLKIYVTVTNNAAYTHGIFAGANYENKGPIVNELHSYLNDSYNGGQDLMETIEKPITINESGNPVFYSFELIPMETNNLTQYENNRFDIINDPRNIVTDDKEVNGSTQGNNFAFLKLDQIKNGVAEFRQSNEVVLEPTRYANRNANGNNLSEIKKDIAHEVGHKLMSRHPVEGTRNPKAEAVGHNLLGSFMSYGFVVNVVNGRLQITSPGDKVTPITTTKILESTIKIKNVNITIQPKDEKPQ